MKRTFITILIVHRHIKGRRVHYVVGPKSKNIHWLSNKKINMIWKMETIFWSDVNMQLFKGLKKI